MESFLPTEIARLVYGYLIEENCGTAAQLFLETSDHLKECLMVTEKGRRFNTRVSGYNLVDILDKLCEVTCVVKACFDQNVAKGIPEDGLLQQLKSLLIPNEEKKIRLKKSNPVKNSEISLDVFEESLFQSSCIKRVVNDPCLKKENGSINQVKKEVEASASQAKDTEVDQVTVGDGNVREFDTPESKENCNNKHAVGKENDFFRSSDHLVNTDHYASNFHPIVWDVQEDVCVGTLQRRSEEIDSESIVKFDLAKTGSTRTGARPNYESQSIVSNTAVGLSPLPVAIKQICSQNQSTLTNFRVQANTSPKFQFSLLNHQETVQENDHAKNFQKPLTTHNSMQPFIRGPATIYVKPPIKNPLISNIFTSEHRPIEKSSERLLLIKPPSVNVEKNSGAPVIKRSGVRTRGGFVKRGGKTQRRVKAHVPSKAAEHESTINFSVGNEQNPQEQLRTCLLNMPTVENEKSADTSLIKETPLVESNFNVALSSTIRGSKQPDSNCQTITATVTSEKPEQAHRNLRKRISSSVPRRGSHIRALDFKTPIKNSIYNRRAMTSPKQIHSNRSPSLKKSLRCVRGTLFKSPSFKKENKAWDADLRMYTSDSTDIPTSVGLQRKINTQIHKGNDLQKMMIDQRKGSSDHPKSFSNSITSTLTPKNAFLRSEESNEDLADKIQKEVLSVINEEEINLIGENTNLMCNSGLDKIIVSDGKGNICSILSSCNNKENSTIQADDYLEETQNVPVEKRNEINEIYSGQVVESLNNIYETQEMQKSEISPDASSLMTPVSKAIHEHREILEKGVLTPCTPPSAENICITVPSKDSKSMNTEPLMKIVSPLVVGLNLSCQDSLEASLIKECTRIEKENMVQRVVEEEKRSAYLNKTESIFDTPQKTAKAHIYDSSIDETATNKKSNISPTSSGTKQQEFQLNDNVMVTNTITITKSETLVTQESTSPSLEERFVQNSDNHDICNPSVSIFPLNRDNVGNSAKGKSEISFKRPSLKQFHLTENKSNSDSESENIVSNNIDKIESLSRTQRNNFEIDTLIEGKSSSSQEECETYKTNIADFGNLKAKTGKSAKDYEIDCGKLIAQCLQSAKENLYGIEKKLSSPSRNLMKNKKEHNIKTLKVKNVIDKKNKSIINSKCKKDRAFRSRIKNVNALFTDTDSSSSEDSDILEMRQQNKSGHNESENSDEYHLSPKLEMNNQPNSHFPENTTTITDENHIDKIDRCITRKEKQFLQVESSQVTNKTNIELGSPHKRSSLEEKENNVLINLPKNLQKKPCSPTITEDVQVSFVATRNPSPEQNVNDTETVSAGQRITRCTDIIETMKIKEKIIGTSKINEHLENGINILSEERQKSLSPLATSKKYGSEHECDPIILKNDTINIQQHNIDKRPDFSEELNNYVYSFTLTLDGKNVTKQLKLSPFYSIFELETSLENSGDRNGKKLESEYHNLAISDSEERSKKRKVDVTKKEGSSNSSFCDEKKTTPSKKHKRECTFTHKEPFYSRSERHRIYRCEDKRINRNSRKRERNYLRDNYNRKYLDEYSSPRFRRYTPRHWATRRRMGDAHRRNIESPKRSSYRNKETVHSEIPHRYKDRSDTKTHEKVVKINEVGSRNHYKKEGGNSSKPGCVYSIRPMKGKRKERSKFDKEDGELSESSFSAYSLKTAVKNTPITSQRAIKDTSGAPPVDEDTRAKLKKVNLDQFLSMLHGNEK